ncbi:ComEC/Rec2 family competence protein [Hydrogenoanaerobacterium sp.]|uniref:ComEC/Rec2 family competence protein n=1 Tax=Hydrogenoanaerobacterium sp. TaxID=2953763 RepID=UPI00289B8AB6|nr:ComEC/Rec2 family competence protein [Hydrogenoanaerobacterium sp.]
MSRYRRPQRLNWGFAVVVSVLLAAAILITLADSMDFKFIPTWDEIFAETELADPVFTSADASVHIIDIGQGDSILIKTPEHNILIDAGERDKGAEVVSYLQSQDVMALDYIIATHPHADHIGGMSYVIEQMDVGSIIAPKVPDSITPTSKAYKNMLTAIQQKGLKIKLPKAGDVYNLEDGSQFTILGPVEPSTEMNNNSVVLKFEYGDISFVLTGDCEKDMENEILETGADVSADVLKLGHHGSNTSTGKAWLTTVSPSYAAISCGKDNSYGHPHKEVVSRLKEAGVTYYRTDLAGTIIFETDGTAIQVKTEK